MLGHRPDLAAIWEAADASFPIRVTRSFASRADLSDPTDPLAIQVLPDPRELDEDGLDDPVGEKQRAPVPWVVRKYADRALLLVTKRCHLYCRYCFRRTHAPGEALDPTPTELDRAFAYLASQPDLREVILSGGDPLVLPDAKLLALIDRVRALGLRVRIHTRAPITYPHRVTPELASALADRAVWMVVHCNHPRELAPDVVEALATLVDAGVPVLDQAVLLAGVNDDADVLVELFETLVRLRVRPYYLHHPDAVSGNAHLRVPAARGLALMAEVRGRIGGLAVPRYVVDPPTGEGKRDVSVAEDAVY
ncbi:MAG: KamA family radical SAM protein [Alphaproteobacteria bacterium]|nr:KamA family radical SAM protein [Alphaproteobacteria bacterium]